MFSTHNVCFVGAGSMAEAILSGLLNKEVVGAEQISVTNRQNKRRLQELTQQYGVIADPEQKKQMIEEADILILAMKPKDVQQTLADIRSFTGEQQLIISVAAGIPTALISNHLGHDAPVIRAMPNTSAVVGMSATGMCAGQTAQTKHIDWATRIFEPIGLVVHTKEEQMDAITGLAGSGPAYVYAFMEGMIQGGIDVGLDSEQSKKLTLQAIMGAAQMVLETGSEPAQLRAKVTSPNGTTQAGLDVLQSYRFEEAIQECIKNATHRSKELGQFD